MLVRLRNQMSGLLINRLSGESMEAKSSDPGHKRLKPLGSLDTRTLCERLWQAGELEVIEILGRKE